jgi:alanine-synthesizing transaminase
MEDEGHKIIKLNIGNLAPFGFDPPEEIQQDMIRNLPDSAGYSDSKGIFAARKAVMHYTQKQGIKGVTLDDIYLGNGASELIVMATNALLDDGDELLLPSPDYPLWTAAASLSGGVPVHYVCDEANGWMPELGRHPRQDHAAHQGHRRHQPQQPHGRAVFRRAAARASWPGARARPGAVCGRGVRQGAVRRRAAHAAGQPVHRRAHADLQLALQGLPFLRLPRRLDGGLGRQEAARDYIEGLNMLANIKLCSNVPGQWAIQTALGGYQSINDLVNEGGRLRRQRDLAYELITADSRRQLRQAAGGAVHVSAPRSRDVPHRGRPASSSWRCCAPRA